MTAIQAAGTAEILAVLGRGDEVALTQTAEVIARLAGGRVRRLRLADDLSPGRAASQVIRTLHQPGTVTGVLPGDEMWRPLWQPVAQRSVKPVVLMPAGARPVPRRIRRVLLPLDGTARSAAAVAETAERFARGGAELVVLHVFDAETVPKFWNQHAHAGQAWEQEFLARYCALPGARLELRSGAAAEHVAKVAGDEQADMIALAWSQRLDPGRAAAVRRTILEAEVPVMLFPMPADLRTFGPAAPYRVTRSCWISTAGPRRSCAARTARPWWPTPPPVPGAGSLGRLAAECFPPDDLAQPGDRDDAGDRAVADHDGGQVVGQGRADQQRGGRIFGGGQVGRRDRGHDLAQRRGGPAGRGNPGEPAHTGDPGQRPLLPRQPVPEPRTRRHRAQPRSW